MLIFTRPVRDIVNIPRVEVNLNQESNPGLLANHYAIQIQISTFSAWRY